MSWTDVTPAIGVDKPIRASTHAALFANFAALAAGDPGAPRVTLPQAARTDEANAALVLQPDGAGGVRWGNLFAAIVGGQHIAHNGGAPVTWVPADRVVWAVHGTATNTSYFSLVVPNPSAALAGHVLLASIDQGGTYGGGRLRQGHPGGAVLAQWNNGDRYRCILACDGADWFFAHADRS